MIERNRLVYGI